MGNTRYFTIYSLLPILGRSTLGATCSHRLTPISSNKPHSISSFDGCIACFLLLQVNNCSGKMGKAVLKVVDSTDLMLNPLSFGCAKEVAKPIEVCGKEIKVHGPSNRGSILALVFREYLKMIVVDYSVPDAVNDNSIKFLLVNISFYYEGNAEVYCNVKAPFVMRTTGGDRDWLYKIVEDSNLYAIIFPQMGKQVVAFLATMEIMAKQFPGAFSGYSLKMVGVPEEYLSGHAFHLYHLVSFEFQQNVYGKSIYAEGTVVAVLFLAKRKMVNLYSQIHIMSECNV
ncbi:hypothetical protein ACJRO7_000291 [Eucalyptus globulus]|uniref:Uncharacterized protein n=1 Tax=Eucalyptus globulus TaxID=34317 RepID=A0ABD3LN54_EUCGL